MNLSKWRGGTLSRVIFWAALCFAFTMAVLPHPPPVPGNPNDKLQHIMAFAVLALLASFAYPSTRLVQLLLRLSMFGAFIEVVQAIPFLHRDSDVWDWIADTAALSIVLLLLSCLRRRSG